MGRSVLSRSMMRGWKSQSRWVALISFLPKDGDGVFVNAEIVSPAYTVAALQLHDYLTCMPLKAAECSSVLLASD